MGAPRHGRGQVFASVAGEEADHTAHGDEELGPVVSGSRSLESFHSSQPVTKANMSEMSDGALGMNALVYVLVLPDDPL